MGDHERWETGKKGGKGIPAGVRMKNKETRSCRIRKKGGGRVEVIAHERYATGERGFDSFSPIANNITNQVDRLHKHQKFRDIRPTGVSQTRRSARHGDSLCKPCMDGEANVMYVSAQTARDRQSKVAQQDLAGNPKYFDYPASRMHIEIPGLVLFCSNMGAGILDMENSLGCAQSDRSGIPR